MNSNVTSAEILLSLKEQFNQSKRRIEVLSPCATKTDIIKAKWNIPENTLLGVILYNTGGIVIDGWIRVLGSGERDVASWNETLNIDSYVVIADDVLGGLFGLPIKSNIIHYFAPDTLEWEDTKLTYPQFIRWLAEGDVDLFYSDYRWNNWETDVVDLSFFEGISFYPFLWAKSEQERSRKAISLKEIVLLSFDIRKAL